MLGLYGWVLIVLIGILILIAYSIGSLNPGLLSTDMPIRKADALVVLAGGFGERIKAASELYLEEKASLIILTNDGVRGGWSKKRQRNLYRIELDQEALIERGVTPEDIIKLPYTRSGTIYDALVTRKFIERHTLRHIYIVTSDYHMKRAVNVFKKVFAGKNIEISAYPAKSGEYQDLKSKILWYRNCLMEPVKSLYYGARFFLLETFGFYMNWDDLRKSESGFNLNKISIGENAWN